ncbi:MAG: cytochrome c biogenesis protein CcdA, partial [Desulfuromonadales bacterium]
MPHATNITLWIAFSAGVLSFFSPCVLPLIPSYITYITGLSFGQLKEAHPSLKVRGAVLFHSLVFIAGFSAVFIGLGALAGLASSSFQAHLREGLGWIQKIGGVLIFLFGVHLSGIFHFGVLLGEKRVHIHRK